MKRFCLWCAAVLIPVLAACSFSLIPQTEFTEPKLFDLVTPAPLVDLPFSVEVDAFSSECSGRFKMVFREKGNQIDVDEYNRWSMPPGSMLTKYLAARFAAPPDNQGRHSKRAFLLDGSVLACELNKATNQVELMIRYVITDPDDGTFKVMGNEDCLIPVKEPTPEAFAEGMNTAAAKFADKIVDVLKDELKKLSAEAKTSQQK